MKFDAEKHHRGMHSLNSEHDHLILVRARLKGLLIHPGILDIAHIGYAINDSSSSNCVHLKPTQPVRIKP